MECYPDSKAVIKHDLYSSEGCFSTSSLISIYLEQLFAHSNGKREINWQPFPAFVPETVTVANGFSPGKANQKGYPMYNYMNEQGFPRSLRTYHPTKYRIFCKWDTSSVLDVVNEVPEIVSPMVIELSDGSDGGTTDGTRLVSAQREGEDLDKHKKLFKGADYVRLATQCLVLTKGARRANLSENIYLDSSFLSEV